MNRRIPGAVLLLLAAAFALAAPDSSVEYLSLDGQKMELSDKVLSAIKVMKTPGAQDRRVVANFFLKDPQNENLFYFATAERLAPVDQPATSVSRIWILNKPAQTAKEIYSMSVPDRAKQWTVMRLSAIAGRKIIFLTASIDESPGACSAWYEYEASRIFSVDLDAPAKGSQPYALPKEILEKEKTATDACRDELMGSVPKGKPAKKAETGL